MADQAPYFSDVADAPESGSAHWLKAQDGLRIRVVHWPLDGAKGTILMFPGRTEYAEKYGRAARAFAKHGYAMIAVDWRGQGLADRMAEDRGLGHVEKFTDYQLDVATVLQFAKDAAASAPIYLIAHSMGGCIGLRALMDGLPVNAAAFSAPMWGVLIDQPLRAGAWALGTIGPMVGLGQRVSPGRDTSNYVEDAVFEGNELTNDPEMYTYMQDQLRAHPDLGLGGPSINWIGQALYEMNTLSSMDSPSVPCFAAVGTNETIVDPAQIKERMGRWANGSLEIYQDAKHEIIIEVPDVRNDFVKKTVELFDEHP